MDLDEHKKLEWFKHQSAHLGRMAEFTHEFALISLRYLFLINGGAAIAFLTLLGTSVGNKLDIYAAGVPVGAWVAALFMAAAASRQMYFSQFNFYKARSQDMEAILKRDEGKEEEAIVHDETARDCYAEANRRRDRGHGLSELSWALFGVGALFAIFAYIDRLENAPS